MFRFMAAIHERNASRILLKFKPTRVGTVPRGTLVMTADQSYNERALARHGTKTY